MMKSYCGRPHYTSRARAGRPSKWFEKYCAEEGEDPEYGCRLVKGFKIIGKEHHEKIDYAEIANNGFYACSNWDEWG
jgi:hypothetical protein